LFLLNKILQINTKILSDSYYLDKVCELRHIDDKNLSSHENGKIIKRKFVSLPKEPSHTDEVINKENSSSKNWEWTLYET